MTVSSSVNKVSHIGDGISTVFPFNIQFFDTSDLVVIWTDALGVETVKVEGAQYNVVGAESGGRFPSGANVVFTTGNIPGVGVKVTILRELPITQEADYVENDPFPAETHEAVADRAIMIMQQFEEDLTRIIHLPISSPLTDLTLPTPIANFFWRWNATADAVIFTDITGLGAIGVPVSIANGGTAASTVAGAKSNLGLSALDVHNIAAFV